MKKAVAKETQKITKQFLKDYAQLLEEIEGEQERLEMIIQKMISSSAGIGDGMPHGNTKDPNVLALQLSIKDDLKERLTALNREEEAKRTHIEAELQNRVDDPQERRTIRLHYIDRLDWTEVRSVMFGKRKDYYEAEEKYTRLVFRIHGNALAKLNPKGGRHESNSDRTKK